MTHNLLSGRGLNVMAVGVGDLRRRKVHFEEIKEGGSKSSSSRTLHRVEWDSVFWMLLSFALLYITEFASNVLINPAVLRQWLLLSVLALLVTLFCMAYVAWTHPTLNNTNWHEKAPFLISISTASGLIGGLSLCLAVWPVWGYYTIAIIPTLFMGFISTVSLFNI